MADSRVWSEQLGAALAEMGKMSGMSRGPFRMGGVGGAW